VAYQFDRSARNLVGQVSMSRHAALVLTTAATCILLADALRLEGSTSIVEAEFEEATKEDQHSPGKSGDERPHRNASLFEPATEVSQRKAPRDTAPLQKDERPCRQSSLPAVVDADNSSVRRKNSNSTRDDASALLSTNTSAAHSDHIQKAEVEAWANNSLDQEQSSATSNKHRFGPMTDDVVIMTVGFGVIVLVMFVCFAYQANRSGYDSSSSSSSSTEDESEKFRKAKNRK